MDVQVGALVHGAINSGRDLALPVVKGEVPSLAAGCAALDAKVADVNHA